MLSLSTRTVTLRHSIPFRISRSTFDQFEVVEVAVGLGGELVGYGEAAPHDHYGETPETASAFLAEAAPLLGDDPFAFDEIEARLAGLASEMAARAGLDAALHDLCGKILGLPTWRLIGARRRGPATSMTIGLGEPDEMAARARLLSDGRFRRLKLKLGGGDGRDVERVLAVREASDLILQVDVNEHWTIDEALDSIPRLGELGVEYVEQPLPAHDPDGPRLKERSPLPLYADEDSHTAADLVRCRESFHGVNVKLAKCGGLRGGIAMIDAARALGLGVMVGCMNESSLGIAPACHLASRCDFVDLDTNLMLRADPWQGLDLRDGAQTPSAEPGLGVVPVAA